MIDFKVLPEALLFIAGAVPNTLFMAFVSIFFGILFGSFYRCAPSGKQYVYQHFLCRICFLLPAVPGIVQLFIVYYSLPYFLAPVFSAFSGTEVKPFDVSPYWSVYLCFILYNTAYQSENIRGALRSVDHGQYEAAVAMGMTSFRAFTRIVLPQAFVVALPAFFTYYLKTIKLLALVFTVKVVDMFAKADIFSALYNRRMEPYIADAIAYWGLAILLTFLFDRWKRNFAAKASTNLPDEKNRTVSRRIIFFLSYLKPTSVDSSIFLSE